MRRFATPLIFFLDDDLRISAQNLTDKYLIYNIKNCCQILVCCNLYNCGIRSEKFCKYYFCKERKEESLRRFFPTWPLNSAPSFVKYKSPEAKWCRMCKNHYDVVLTYFAELLDEYSYRTGKEHELYDMLDFLRMIPYEISLRTGNRVVYIEKLKIVLPWKNLPLKYRRKDIIKGYREYYKSLIFNPFEEYLCSKRDIPQWLLDGKDIEHFDTSF